MDASAIGSAYVAEAQPNTPGKRSIISQSVPGLDNLVHDHVVHVLDPRVAEDQT